METNKIQEKVNALTQEREQLTRFMEELNQRFTAARERIIQIDGALATLSELFKADEEDNTDDNIQRVDEGEKTNDTKGKTKSRSNSNKK